MLFGWWKRRLRKKLLASPFPLEWTPYLDRLFFYAGLTATEQKKLRDDLRIFVAEKTWLGGGDLTICDEIQVIIAAQACLLTLALPGDPYQQVQTILVHPSGYVAPAREQVGNVELHGETPMLGEAHYRGPLLLSWRQVQQDTDYPEDGHNLVFHEFAHKLDMLDGDANGAPPLPARLAQRWQRVMSREFRRLNAAVDARRATLLDDYGAENEAEFFAVATECFFTRPLALRNYHSDLYEILAEYYQQDPAERLMPA